MAVEEQITDLPLVASSQLTDILMCVQGYTSPASLGLSVQQTWSQVLSLMQSNIILFNAGNPNGAVAGTTYQFCWDTTDKTLFICTTSGTSSLAVWTQITNNSSGTNWTTVSTTPFSMVTNHKYINTNAGAASFVLPTTSSVGDFIQIMGNGAGGFTITQAASQQIQIGSSATTAGVGGSVASTNRYDSLSLVCTTANLVWQANLAPEGILTIV